MTLYKAHTSVRDLTTYTRFGQYPARWELLRWYRCLRKFPYPSDAIAYLAVQGRGEEYSHYPCPISPEHWHIGRGHNKADPRYLLQRAKRAYRRSERDEIIARHRERHGQETPETTPRSRGSEEERSA